MTLTGGEPLLQAAFAREYFRLCKEAGLHTALDTSGAVVTEEALAVLDFTDLVLLDVKTADDAFHKSYTGMERKNNRLFLDHLQSVGKPVWIRHVLVPGLTDIPERLEGLAEFSRDIHASSGSKSSPITPWVSTNMPNWASGTLWRVSGRSLP